MPSTRSSPVSADDIKCFLAERDDFAFEMKVFQSLQGAEILGERLQLRASADCEVFQAAAEDESVIGRIVAAQREELEREIGELKIEAERIAGDDRELVGEVPF